MSIQIIRPKRDSVLDIGKNLGAYGRSGDEFDRVVGTCAPIPGPGSPSPETRPIIQGKLTALVLVEGNSAQPLFYKWLMVFSGLQLGSYRLTLTASDAEGNDSVDQIEFQVSNLRKLFLDILDPHSGENITFEKDDFLASGDTDTPIGSVTLTGGPDNVSVPLLLNDYHDTLHFWSALATESLLSGEYTFTISDGQSSESVDSLTVD